MADTYCKYCEHWQEARTAHRQKIVNGKQVIYKHRCPIIKKYIPGDHEACDKFNMGVYFWCRLKQQFIPVRGCYSNQRNGNEDCFDCVQYPEVNEGGRLMMKYGRPL